jgi:hypothetical protein
VSSREVVWNVGCYVGVLLGAGGGKSGCRSAVMVILSMRALSNPAPGLSIYRPSLNPLATLAILGSSWWWACWRPPCRRAGPPDWIR